VNGNEAEAIAEKLLTNMRGMKYGEVGVSITIHAGRVVETEFSKTERNRGGEPTHGKSGRNINDEQ